MSEEAEMEVQGEGGMAQQEQEEEAPGGLISLLPTHGFPFSLAPYLLLFLTLL